MLNAEERRRLGEDSISPLGAVLKCITALLVLVSIAAGPWALLTAGGPQGADAVRASLQSDQAVAQSSRVLEARNAYESARQNSSPGPGNAIAGP